MLQITINERERKKLERYRGQASSSKSEKALMVLLSHEGKSTAEIGKILKRHPHTVSTWLRNYQKNGLEGLERRYIPGGRPQTVREEVKNMIEMILTRPPSEFGYQAERWTVSLIKYYLEKRKGIKAGLATIERALKDLGYSYRHTVPGISDRVPSKAEKIETIEKMAQDIIELARQEDCEIFILDEAHFSSEPYLMKGWQKKRWPPENTLPGKPGKTHSVWLLESGKQKILLEKIEP